MKLLVVEDERRMLELLLRGLSEEGHTVSCAVDGSQGLQMVRHRDFDVVILDVMMPKMDGFELARNMRVENNCTPVLMLTARDSVPDVVHGLDLGADDYMTKPFSFDELLLRLRAVHRAAASRKTQLRVGDLLLNVCTREVSRDQMRISLTRTEYQLLERLMLHAGQIVPREMLMAAFGREIGSNSLDAFVRLLRNKIDCDDRRRLIHTVRGVGYVISSDWQS
ncbi:MAG TPA: response regulator transcription factor [Verrucomicrobiae bacterium]|jgi:DNA-binding response OmpR family regulator|nr:response regulator transcription factor [Verrucomicrobiae bacterium]